MQDTSDVEDAVAQCNFKSIGESSTHILEQLREQQVDHSGIMVPKLQQQLMESQIQHNHRANEQIDTLVSRMLNLSPEDVSAATRMTSGVDRNADFASLFPSESIEEEKESAPPEPKKKPKDKEDRPIRKIQLD